MTIGNGESPSPMGGNSVDSLTETLFTVGMTNTTTREAVPMPSVSEVHKALETLDLLICAAEDSRVFAADTLVDLADAYAVFAKFMEHPDAREGG